MSTHWPFLSGLYFFSLSQQQQQTINTIRIHNRQQARMPTITANTIPTINPVGRRPSGSKGAGLGGTAVGSLQFSPRMLLAHTVTSYIFPSSSSTFLPVTTMQRYLVVPFSLQLALLASIVILNSPSWFLDPVVWTFIMNVNTGRRSLLSMVQVTVRLSFSRPILTNFGLLGGPKKASIIIPHTWLYRIYCTFQFSLFSRIQCLPTYGYNDNCASILGRNYEIYSTKTLQTAIREIKVLYGNPSQCYIM